MQPVITPFVLLPGAGMLLVSLVFVIYSLRRGGAWSYLGLGALVWTITVAIKFAVALLFNARVYEALFVPGSLFAPGSLLLYGYIGSLTGLTEVLLAWLLLRYTRLGRVTWPKALAFGIGFGAFEALLLGLSSLVSAAAALTAPESLPANTLTAIAMANDPLYGLAPVAERVAAILVHTFCNALLFYGVLVGQSRWLWLSMVYKSLLDTAAAFAQFWGVETVTKLWTIEAVMIVFGLVAWWGIRWVHQRYPYYLPSSDDLSAARLQGQPTNS